MSEFGGLRKHEKTQHARVGLGSAALAAAVVLPRQSGPHFPYEKKKEKGLLPNKTQSAIVANVTLVDCRQLVNSN